MKKYLPIFVGILAAIVSAILIYFRKDIGDTGTVKTFAQIILPVLLAVIFAFISGTMKQKLVQLGLMLGSFFVILSILSPFAFEYWITNVTPAGYPYSHFGLDALYPYVGMFIVLIAFIVGLVVVLTKEVLHKVMHRKDAQSTAKQ